MKLKLIQFLVFSFFFFGADAAVVDTVEVMSPSMNKKIKTVIIKPDRYDKNNQYPVVYLLHGYSGNYAAWTKAEAVIQSVDLYNQIVVCPDGGYGSWYWDSPVDPNFRYETFVYSELVNWVDNNLPTIKSSNGRAIAGLSMGGHGALYLAIKHPQVFGACGSMSGGVDIRPFPNNWEMSKRLGKYAEFPDRWENNTVINMLHLIEPGTLRIIVDCGTEDFFFKVNEELHRQMLLRNIQHDYTTRPGGHTWAYWQNAVKFQLLFFHNFFTSKT